jgi:hypothetical protein
MSSLLRLTICYFDLLNALSLGTSLITSITTLIRGSLSLTLLLQTGYLHWREPLKVCVRCDRRLGDSFKAQVHTNRQCVSNNTTLIEELEARKSPLSMTNCHTNPQTGLFNDFGIEYSAIKNRI